MCIYNSNCSCVIVVLEHVYDHQIQKYQSKARKYCDRKSCNIRRNRDQFLQIIVYSFCHLYFILYDPHEIFHNPLTFTSCICSICKFDSGTFHQFCHDFAVIYHTHYYNHASGHYGHLMQFRCKNNATIMQE